MPQAVVAAYVKAAFVVAKLAATSTLFNIGVKVAGIALLSTITSKLFGPKMPGEAGLQGQDVMNRSAIQYRQIVYGQTVVSGPIVYNNTSGLQNRYLWYVIALCEGESEDLIEVRFDDRVVPKADIAWTAGTGGADGTGTGAVSTTEFIGENSANGLHIWYYLGDAAQPVPGALDTEFADIDSTHRGRGVTHMVCRLYYQKDTEDVWEQGPPQNIRAVIKGRKIYDSRLDTTNGGTGSHRYTDSTTWEYSDNPALCVADYLVNIMGVDPATRIDWPSFASAADDCDVSVTVPSGSETRFTCNGALSLGSTHKDNLESLTSSCDGKLSYSQGKWRLRASVWEASSVTFTEDDLAGPVQVRGSAPKSERFNLIRGVFIDPDRSYEAAEFPHVESATYQTRDNGEVIPYDLQLPMTNSRTMAERIAYRILEQGDNQTIVDLTLNLVGAKVQIGDVFTLDLPTYGWTDGGNEIIYSEDFANAAWGKTRATSSKVASIADPFGGQEAYRLIGDGTAGNQRLDDSSPLAQVAGEVYVFSVYAKKRDYDWCALLIGDAAVSDWSRANYNLVTGELGIIQNSGGFEYVDYGAEFVGNGWYRVWIAARANSADSATRTLIYLAEDDNDLDMPASTDGGYFFGAQLEEGFAPTLYKRTTGTAVTTSAKTFRCIDWARNTDGTFKVTGREDDSGDYTDPLSGEYASETTGAITLPADEVPAPSNLAAVSREGGIELSWDDPPSRLYDQIEIWASDDVTTGFSTAWLAATTGKSPHFFETTYQYSDRAFWIRAIRNDGNQSDYEPVTTGNGVVEGPAVPSGTNLVPDGDFSGTGFSPNWLGVDGGDSVDTYETANDRIELDWNASISAPGYTLQGQTFFSESTGRVVIEIDFDDEDGVLSDLTEAYIYYTLSGNTSPSPPDPFINGLADKLPIVSGRKTYRWVAEYTDVDASHTFKVNAIIESSGTTPAGDPGNSYIYGVQVRTTGGEFIGVSDSTQSKPGMVPALASAPSGKVFTDQGTFETLEENPLIYGITSSQTFTDQTWTDVTGLTGMTLETGETYNVQLELWVLAQTSPFEFRFVFSNAPSNNGDYHWLYQSGTGTWDGGGIENDVEDTTGNQTTTASGLFRIAINMRFVANATTGGTFKMQARRGDTSTLNTTGIYAGSMAKVTKVS